MEELEGYRTKYRKSMVHIEDIVTRHTNKMESFKEHKTEIVRRIKQAEDIAQIKEAKTERKFIEEISELYLVMKRLNEESQMEPIEGKLNLEMETEQKLKQAEKKLKEANEKLKGAYDMKKLSQEMETEKKLKEKMYPTKITRNMRKKMEAHKRRVVREQVEKDIMEKTNKMMEVTVKLKEAEDIMEKVTEAKNREKIKEAEIIKKVKNMIEAEYLERMVVEITTKELSELWNIEKINELEEKNTITIAAGSTSRTKHTNEALNLAKTNPSKNTNIPEKAHRKAHCVMADLYAQFWKLCWQNNLNMEEVERCLAKYRKSSGLEATMLHIQDIVTRVTNKMECLKEYKTEIVRRIKQAEDAAQIKEADIERKFIEEISEMYMVMKTLNEECQKELIEGKLSIKIETEKRFKQAEKKHKGKEANKKLKGAYDMKKLRQEMETEKIVKEKMYPTKITRNMRKKMEAHKRSVVREQVEKDIMEKTNKMMELTCKLKEAEDIMEKVTEAKNREKIKEAEIIKKIKNMIEAEYLERMVVEITTTELAELLNIEKMKESEKNTLTITAGSTSRTKHYKTGTVRSAACKLFNASMERCNFNIGEQQALIVSCDKEGYGDYDYACGNVLRIWPKLKKMGTKLQGPKDVGMEIKRNLPQSDMIEGTPSLHSFGIVTFKISGKWMAKRIHRMLIEGIETWAPEVSLERAIVDHPSLDIVEGMHMDMLRRRYISRSLTRMLQYFQVHVLNSAHEAGHMDLATNVIEIEERDGEVLIYNKVEGELQLLLKRKSDRGLSNVFKDLGALWYGVKKLNAQRLLYVTHVAKQEYIEMCFTAAKGAKWLSSAPLELPCAIYVGYRSCTTKLEKLLYMLNEAKALHKVASFVLRGNAANYTARDVLECCIQYTLLKTHRMADCTFDIDDLLDEEGNTFLYLLNTQARIRSITDKYRKTIRELIKKASVFILEKDGLLEKGEERELGFHILDLTEVLRESCFPVLPHNLCKYLYNLSQIFNRYLVSTYARGNKSRFFLLMCEATAVVMEKCFHLLDITPQSSKNELGVTRLIYGAQLSVERPINVKEVEDTNAPRVGRDAPKIQNPRFEPFSINIIVNPDFESDIKPVKLFGYIDVADTCGLRSDGSISTHRADVSYVHLFRRPWNDPIDIITGGCLGFGDPSCSHSVPFSSSMGVAINLVAINKKDDLVVICNMQHDLDFSVFLASKLDGFCGHFTVGSEGGQARINYILLKDAVDATLEVTFRTSFQNIKVCGSIDAYYEDGFPGKCDAFTKTFYTAPLFEINSPRILKGGPIQLQKSRMAVPRDGSLKVIAHLQHVQDGKSWKMILSDSCNFPSQTNRSITKYLKGSNCSFEVKVNWSYCQGS